MTTPEVIHGILEDYFRGGFIENPALFMIFIILQDGWHELCQSLSNSFFFAGFPQIPPLWGMSTSVLLCRVWFFTTSTTWEAPNTHTHRHTDTHRHTHRHTHTHTDTQTHRHRHTHTHTELYGQEFDSTVVSLLLLFFHLCLLVGD